MTFFSLPFHYQDKEDWDMATLAQSLTLSDRNNSRILATHICVVYNNPNYPPPIFSLRSLTFIIFLSSPPTFFSLCLVDLQQFLQKCSFKFFCFQYVNMIPFRLLIACIPHLQTILLKQQQQFYVILYS